MATRITPSTLFKDLPFLSTHNSTLIDAQLCGTVSMELIERTLNMLEFFPICIELDVCKYSKQGALINTTFIDHYSKSFITFPTTLESTSKFIPKTISRKDTAYQTFNTSYHQSLSKEYSVNRIFQRINSVLNSKSTTRFPLIISMDISALKSKSSSVKTDIFEEIKRYFYDIFDDKSFKTRSEDRQGDLLTKELSETMNLVLLRINNDFGDISKPPNASEKIVVSKTRAGELNIFKQPENHDETRFITRIYPDLIGLGKRLSLTTLSEAARMVMRRGSNKAVRRKGSFSTESQPNNSVTRQIDRSIRSALSSKLPLQRSSSDSVLRAGCEGDPVNYKTLSNLIVKQFILNKSTRLNNVNCVAINVHDLVPKVREAYLNYFKKKYARVRGVEEGSTSSSSSSSNKDLSLSETEVPTLTLQEALLTLHERDNSAHVRGKPKSQRKKKPKPNPKIRTAKRKKPRKNVQ